MRYRNHSGSISATAIVANLRHSDQIGISLIIHRAPDYIYFISVRWSGGEARGRVRQIDPTYGVPHGPDTCTPRVSWDAASNTVHVRAQDGCFEGSDLSVVTLTTDLGVRGKTNVSDFNGNTTVHRN